MTFRPFVRNNHEDTAWMNNPLFQIQAPEFRMRQARVRFVFAILAALAIVTGALIGLSYSGIFRK